MQERLLAVISDDEELDWDETVFGPSGTNVSYITKRDGRSFVYAGGKRLGPLDMARCLRISEDGKRFAFASSKDEKCLVVLDGLTVGLEYDSAYSPFFGPHGRFGFAAQHNAKSFLVVDGKAQEPVDWDINKPRYSCDGQLFGYESYNQLWVPIGGDGDEAVVFDRGGVKSYVVVNGTKYGEEYDAAGGLLFSPTGGHFAFKGTRNGREFLVVDGKELSQHKRVYFPVFNHDGTQIAFSAWGDANKLRIMVNDEAVSGELSVGGCPFWGPKGKVGYMGNPSRGREFIYVGDKRMDVHNTVYSSPKFSPDGRHVAYHDVWKTGKHFVVVDGRKSDEFDFVWDFVFDPESKEVGFGAKKGKELWWKVLKVKD